MSLQAAEAWGEEPGCVLKTLMALVDGKPVCVIVPSDRSMKKLAAAFGGKSAEIMKPADATRISDYKTGGITPLGQMRKIPAAIEAPALAGDLLYINGGQRGLQVRLKAQGLGPRAECHRGADCGVISGPADEHEPLQRKKAKWPE